MKAKKRSQRRKQPVGQEKSKKAICRQRISKKIRSTLHVFTLQHSTTKMVQLTATAAIEYVAAWNENDNEN